MHQLLINADDYGLHPLINSAIHACAEKGRVNSISVMTNASSVEYTALRELQNKGVFVGVHLSWVRSGWLTGKHALFGWRAFAEKLLFGGKRFLHDLHTEAEAQINRLADNGIIPDHLDSHQHVHHLPGVWTIAESLAKQYGINRIRCCKTTSASLQRKGVAGKVLHRLSSEKFNSALHFHVAGMRNTGNYSFEKLLAELRETKGSNTEFILHPGSETQTLHELFPDWGYHWKGELDALLDARLPEAISACNFSLPKRRAEQIK